MGKIYGLGYSEGAGEGPYSLNVTENLGGFNSGPFTGRSKDYLTKLLVRYQRPGWTSFTFKGQGSRSVERGTVFSSQNELFTFSLSNAANIVSNSISLADQTAGVNLALNIANTGSVTVPISGFTVQLGEARRYRITALDTQNTAIVADLIITGMPALLFGAAALTQSELATAVQNGQPLNDARLNVLGLSKVLQDNKVLNRDYNCTGGKYIHILWDAAYGAEPAFGQVKSGPNSFSAYTVIPVSVIDQFGQLRTYRLLTTGIQFGSSVNINIIS